MRLQRILKGLGRWRRAHELLRAARQVREWQSMTLGYLGLVELSYPFTLHFRNGDTLSVESYHDLVTVWVIFFREEYQVPSDCRVIVDAGANIGAFCLYSARRAPRAAIHAVEPFPSTRARLAETIRNNRLEDRVAVYPFGLAGHDSTRYMTSEGPSQSRGTQLEPSAGAIATETRSLDRFLRELGVSHIDLLKMDIEGAEHEVVEHATELRPSRCSRIALEYHPCAPSSKLFQQLRQAGFDCTHDARYHRDSGVAHFQGSIA